MRLVNSFYMVRARRGNVILTTSVAGVMRFFYLLNLVFRVQLYTFYREVGVIGVTSSSLIIVGFLPV